MLAFKSFMLLEEKGGPAIETTGSLTLSGPQKMKPDTITGHTGMAKVPHYSISLPAGFSCPYAEECRSRTIYNGKHSPYKTNKKTGEITGGDGKGDVQDGALCKFRCFAVSGENQYPDVRAMRMNNFRKLTGIDLDKQFPDEDTRSKYGINKGNHSLPDAPIDQMDAVMKDENSIGEMLNGVTHHIHDTDKITQMLIDTIKENHKKIMSTGPRYKGGGVLRVHVSGDFYAQSYFDAWMNTARAYPEITFYSYTKSLPYWIKALEAGTIPANYKLIASYGGTRDAMIEAHGLKFAEVCFSKEYAANRTYSYRDYSGRTVTKTGLPICEEVDAEFEGDDIAKYAKNGSDFPAYGNDAPFGLLLHGQQPSLDSEGNPTEASKSISSINKAAKQELLDSRVAFLVNTANMTELDAHIEVAMRINAYNNERDDKINNSPNRTTKKPYSAQQRMDLVITTIAKYLYLDTNGMPLDSTIVPKKAESFIEQASLIFHQRINGIRVWANKEFGDGSLSAESDAMVSGIADDYGYEQAEYVA